MPVYDVFISYKNEDRLWAERLEQELLAVGLKVFWDKNPTEGLNPGRPWLSQLKQALDDSGAFISLWSERAAARAGYNDREGFIFRRSEFASGTPHGRPVIEVRLDDATSIRGEDHAVDGLKGFKHPNAVPADTWRAVAQSVKRAARPDGVVYVETLVLAATAAEMKAPKDPDALRDFELLVTTLGVEKTIASRYGADRWDWRPYGVKTVREMLVELGLKAEGAQVTLDFVRADEAIWSPDRAKAQAAANKLAGKLALVLVDPLSMFVHLVHRCMGLLKRAQQSPTNAFAVLSPVPADDEPLKIVVDTYIQTLYEASLKPPVPPNVNAPVGMHVRTADELLRVMLLAHARGAHTPTSVRKTTMTEMGAR